MSTLMQSYPEIRRQLKEWSGFPALVEVMEKYQNLRVYVAGGVIRNVLLGLPCKSKDWDFFLAGPSVNQTNEIFKIYGRLTETPYGASRWYPRNDETQYADLIPVTEFVPGLWRCEDIVDVLNQFDFTANAVAFDLRTHESFDPQNGVRDSARRILRMVRFDYPDGPYIPGATLDRNVILWIRILHYAGVLGLTIEPLTQKWLLSRGDLRSYACEFGRQFFQPNLSVWESLVD